MTDSIARASWAPTANAAVRGNALASYGLGVAASHLIQQTSHLGSVGFVRRRSGPHHRTNTNRLIGGTLADLDEPKPKSLSPNPDARAPGAAPHNRWP